MNARVLVDQTHCGRHVTGIERITLELFSKEALAPLDIVPVSAGGRLDMMARQTFALPFALARDPKAILLCPGFPPSPLASLFGRRVLPYIHDVFLATRWEDLNARAKLYMAAPFRLALNRLPRFLANSQTTRDEIYRFCASDAEVALYRPSVRNIFDLASGNRPSRPLDEGGLRLVALGTVEPRKNLVAAADILTALRRKGIARAQLDIVGRAGWGGVGERLAGIDGVTLHGYKPTDEVRAILDAADLLISTSHDEGLGLPLLEAQYAGLPVVAPDRPVFREVLGRSGLLIEPNDPIGAAEKIAALVAEEDWRERHAQSAAANLERWNAAAAGDRAEVVDLIARLAEPGGLPPC
ncbi:MAG TPA: glycosyltransferase [Beijerinckiaceae bacterium]|nr:glycosyltransferase [Beijerinckiaceae bacterium]